MKQSFIIIVLLLLTLYNVLLSQDKFSAGSLQCSFKKTTLPTFQNYIIPLYLWDTLLMSSITNLILTSIIVF
jgi:hypothetical protein